MSKNSNSDNIYEKVIGTIKKYQLIEPNDKIVLGVSGGPDSMCMLNILNELCKERVTPMAKNCPQMVFPTAKNCQKGAFPMAKNCQKGASPVAKFQIVVAHINHMIRQEAIEDELYVKKYCEKNGIEFYSKSIDVQKFANNNKIGTEEAGRKVRYDFFDEIMKKTNANKIAIAHNKNDKVETIIMHALRGSGVSGLIGIQAKRDIYIRPLIECERKEIEKYCEKQNLNPRIDKTNFENKYTRNKIRNVVIPYVQKEFNPNIIQTIDRLSSLILEEENFMDKQTKKIYQELVISEKNERNENTKRNEKKETNENIKRNENIETTENVEKSNNSEHTENIEGLQEEIILDLKKFNNQEKVIKSRIIRYTITRIFGNSSQIELVHMEDIIKLCSNNIGNKFLTPNKNIKILVKNQKIYFKKQRCLDWVNP